MLTTLFIDFGAYGSSFAATSSDINNVAGLSNTGPSVPNVTFSPLSHDYNNSGTFDNGDILDLRGDVITLISRTLEPFDIDIVPVVASSLAQVATTLTSSATSNDAYVLVSEATAAANVNTASGGNAAIRDLTSWSGSNLNDELALVYSGNIYTKLVADGAVPGTATFKQTFASRIAHFVLHEAFHTFGIDHTMFNASSALKLLSNGDLVGSELTSVQLDNPTVVTRLDLYT